MSFIKTILTDKKQKVWFKCIFVYLKLCFKGHEKKLGIKNIIVYKSKKQKKLRIIN